MAHLIDDLLAIRDHLKLTSKDLSAKTRFPADVILDIETAKVLDKPANQRTYVRSYLRNYAKALKVSDTDIVRALDEHFGEGYSGFLAEKYTGLPAANRPAEAQPEMLKRVIATSTHGDTDEFSRPDPTYEHNRNAPPPPELEAVDWSRIRTVKRAFNGRTRLGLFLALALVAAAAAVFAYWKWGGAVDQPAAEPVPAETLPVVPADTLSDSAGVLPTFPDTLEIVLYAATGNLDPVRVISDVGINNYPYWIEQGIAMRFEFVNQITLRGDTPNMMVLFNGHPVPDLQQFVVSDRMLTLRREYFENTTTYRTASNDTTLGALPWPSEIRNRPIFRP